MLNEILTNEFLGNAVLQMSALFFCLVVGVFIVPLVVERLYYYLPRLILMVREGDVFPRSIALTILEAIGWSLMVVALYIWFYAFFPETFYLVTIAPVACVAWGVSLVNMAYRIIRFNKTVKSQFYHKAYMHYITPEALQAYQAFIESLSNMTNSQLEDQARSKKALPYMHRQALHRTMNERGGGKR